MVRTPEGPASTDIIVAWQTGPGSAGSGTASPKLEPPSVLRVRPRQLQLLVWPL